MTSCAAADSYHLGRAHGRLTINPMPAPEARCLQCGCPVRDHVPLRYALRVLFLHLIPERICRWLRPLRRH